MCSERGQLRRLQGGWRPELPLANRCPQTLKSYQATKPSPTHAVCSWCRPPRLALVSKWKAVRLVPPPAGPNSVNVLVPVLSLCRAANTSAGRLDHGGLRTAALLEVTINHNCSCIPKHRIAVVTNARRHCHTGRIHQPRPGLALRVWNRLVARLERTACGIMSFARWSTPQGMPAGVRAGACCLAKCIRLGGSWPGKPAMQPCRRIHAGHVLDQRQQVA